MRYKLLGKSGLRVSELCLGAGTFGTAWGPIGSDEAESQRIFDAFVDAGGNFFDTSNRYQEGESERILGKLIGAEREHFVIGTKFTLYDLLSELGDPNAAGSHRKNLRRSVEGSLKRLGTDYIDLLYVHIEDTLTPIEETMRALDDMVRDGKVLYVGCSNLPSWKVAQANTIADFRGWSRFVANQIEYNLVERTAEKDTVPMCEDQDIAVLCWSALSGGMTSGKYSRPEGPEAGVFHRLQSTLDPANKHYWLKILERNRDIMARVNAIADRIGRSTVQLSLNWLRQQPGVTIPIFSARTLEQTKEDLACLDWSLSPEEMAEVDAATAAALSSPVVARGYPNDFVEFGSPAIPAFEVKKMQFGTVGAQIDDHRSREQRQQIPGPKVA